MLVEHVVNFVLQMMTVTNQIQIAVDAEEADVDSNVTYSISKKFR